MRRKILGVLSFWAGSILLAGSGTAVLRYQAGEWAYPPAIVGTAALGLALVLLASRWLRAPIHRAGHQLRHPLRDRARRRRRVPRLSKAERFDLLEERRRRCRERLRRSVWYRTPIFGRYDPNIRG